MTRSTIFATGTSTGFSLTALGNMLAHTDWVSVISLVGSIAATAIGWYLSRRAEIARATIELERERRQAQRDEMLADAVAALKVKQLASETPPQNR